MRMIRLVLAHCYATTAFFGLMTTTATLSGCSDSSAPEVMAPEKAPAEAGKDSMDAYRAEMNKGKKKGASKKH